MAADYYVGLDLGQAVDFTALAVLERPPGTGPGLGYALRDPQRFPLGTPYTEIVPAVVNLLGAEPLWGRAALVVDQTGVGRAVVDLLRCQVRGRLVPVTITAGREVTRADGGAFHVP